MALYQSLRIDSSAIGRTHGSWTQIGPSFLVVEFYPSRTKRVRHAVCQCACGDIQAVRVQYLRTSYPKRCAKCNWLAAGKTSELPSRVGGVLCRRNGAGVEVGHKCGRLTVCGWQFRIGKAWQAVCECECGRVVSMPIKNMALRRMPKSCGCYRNEQTVARNTTHGGASRDSKNRLYRIWAMMRNRCSNPQNTSYQHYGGKGVSVCDEWQDFAKFREWADANGYADDLTIDRIHSWNNYDPSNCRWITQSENSRRARRLEHARNFAWKFWTV